MAHVSHGVQGGTGVRGPTPRHPDGGHGTADEVGTGANTSAGMPTLGALQGGDDGG